MKMKIIYYFIYNTSLFQVKINTRRLLLILPQIVPMLRYSLLAVYRKHLSFNQI